MDLPLGDFFGEDGEHLLILVKFGLGLNLFNVKILLGHLRSSDIGSESSQLLLDLVDLGELSSQRLDEVLESIGVLSNQSGHSLCVVLKLGELGVADPVTEAGFATAEVILKWE